VILLGCPVSNGSKKLVLLGGRGHPGLPCGTLSPAKRTYAGNGLEPTEREKARPHGLAPVCLGEWATEGL
jgi:hypothetical protein